MSSLKIRINTNGSIVIGEQEHKSYNDSFWTNFKQVFNQTLITSNTRENFLFLLPNLRGMMDLIVSDNFIRAFLENAVSYRNIKTLFTSLGTLCTHIVHDVAEKQDQYNVLKSKSEKIEQYCDPEEILEIENLDTENSTTIQRSEELAELYQTLLDIINYEVEDVNVHATFEATTFEKNTFSAAEFLTESIKSKSQDNDALTLKPFKDNGIAAFLQSCETLGNKIEVGIMIGDIAKLIDNLKSAISYYHHAIRGAQGAKNVFTFMFSGEATWEFDVLNEKRQKIKRTMKLNNQFVTSKFLEYILNLYSSKTDELKEISTDKFVINLMSMGQFLNIDLIEKFRSGTVRLESDGAMSVNGELLPKKFCTAFNAFFGPGNIPSASNGRIEKFNIVYETSISQKKPYWWQQDAVDKAKRGESFIIVGPTSGGKTYASELIIANLLNLRRTQGRIFVYSAPIDQLAIQTFSAMYVSFKDLRSSLAIVCECCSYIPPNATVFIGTPKELRDYFRKIHTEVVRENNENRMTPASILPRCVSEAEMRSVYTLIIDECHTISEHYNSVQSGKIVSKANEELLEMLYHVGGDEPIFIGLSATLSMISMNELINKVKQKTNISHIDLIYYDFSDIGAFKKPEFDENELADKVKSYTLPQIKYPISMKTGVIQRAHDASELDEQIDVTPQFLEELMYKAKEEGVLPCAFFFENESEAIVKFKNFLDYIQAKIDRSSWKAMHTEYWADNNSRASENHAVHMKKYIEKIEREIDNHLSGVITRHTEKIPQSIMNSLLDEYKRLSGKSFDNICACVTMDLYGFLVEYIQYRKTKTLFVCPIHPYYNFGDNGKVDAIDDESGRAALNELLLSQDISTRSKQGNALFENIHVGLRYGLTTITSTMPLGLQAENAKIVNSIKRSTTIKSSFTFSDDGLGQGIDMPFNSVAIINSSLKDISESKFLQTNGRCGRNKGDGKFGKSITFTVNVANAFSISTAEDLSFESSLPYANFYTPDNITQKLERIIEFAEDILIPLQNGGNVNIDLLITEDLFPCVLTDTNKKSERIKIIKRELRELYEICKIICPSVAERYIIPLFYFFQREGYYLIMTSAS